MADFSIGEALGAGFGLVGRRPISVLTWGLAYVLLGVALPLGLVFWALGPDIVGLMSKLQSGLAPNADPQVFMALQAKIMVVQPVMILAPLIVETLVGAAAFRAVLEPDNRGFAYLRLGRRELWLGLVILVGGFLTMIALFMVEILALVLGLLLNLAFEAAHLDWAFRIVAFVALGLVLLIGSLAVAVRFSLAGPMSFAEGQFRLFESWELTRGHGWKLLGLALLVAIIGMVLAILFECLIAGGVILAVLASHIGPADFTQLAQHPETQWRSGLSAALAVAAIALSFAIGTVFAISLAPWAVAYRELLPGAKPSPREGGLYVPAPSPSPLIPGEGLQPDDHAHADPHASGDGSAHAPGHSESE